MHVLTHVEPEPMVVALALDDCIVGVSECPDLSNCSAGSCTYTVHVAA